MINEPNNQNNLKGGDKRKGQAHYNKRKVEVNENKLKSHSKEDDRPGIDSSIKTKGGMQMKDNHKNFERGDAIRPKEGNCVHGHRICGICDHNWKWFLRRGCEQIYDNPTKGR